MPLQMEMQNVATSQYYFQGLEETIGPIELEKLFQKLPHLRMNQTLFSSEQINPLQEKMSEFYGAAGARGISICSGRAAFKHLLEQQGQLIGFDNESFRFLPGRLKLKKGLTLLANWFEKTYHETTQLEDQGDFWLLKISTLPDNLGDQNCGNLCDFTAGVFQEFMTWAGGGRFFRIVETTCRVKGDEYCGFLIDKNPID
ncbi:MAG: 4-vinyl reductase [Anaerolineaceae bacterium]